MHKRQSNVTTEHSSLKRGTLSQEAKKSVASSYKPAVHDETEDSSSSETETLQEAGTAKNVVRQQPTGSGLYSSKRPSHKEIKTVERERYSIYHLQPQ